MNYLVNGHNVSLDTDQFLAAGGQGNVYKINKTVYKVYIDPSQMIPMDKIKELSALADSRIIRPEHGIYLKTKLVGYTMPFVSNTFPLCKLFPKGFKNKNNITIDILLSLIKELKSIVEYVHSNKILIVDLNEFNFLVQENLKKIFAIDVDNWQTPSFAAQAIKPNIKDPHNKTFSELTDWFAFAIITFQMMIGIHPFLGNHPIYNKDWETRMKKNASVFDTGVVLPPAVEDFSIIPSSYLAWFKALFSEGKRFPPPDDFVIQTQIQKFVTEILSNVVETKVLKHFSSKIIRFIDYGYKNLAVLVDSYIWNNNSYKRNVQSCPLIFDDILYEAGLDNNTLVFRSISGLKTIKMPIDYQLDQLMSFENRLFGKIGSNILEFSLTKIGSDIFLSHSVLLNCPENATKLYVGCSIHSLMNSTFISIFPDKKTSYSLRVKELDDYTILDAAYSSGVFICSVVNKQSKQYAKMVFRFDTSFKQYDCRIIHDVHEDIDFVILDTGIVVHLIESGKAEIFKSTKDHSILKEINDIAFENVILGKDQKTLLLLRDNSLFSAKMK